MANAKYDNTDVMADSGQLNWTSDHILALLTTEASFDAAHKRLSETGAVQVGVSEIVGRFMGSGGQAMGLPVSFIRVRKERDHQVLVVKDVGDADPMVLSYYDVDAEDGPLRMINNGTLILRPVTITEGQPPGVGMWLQV